MDIAHGHKKRGFTLIELLVVIAIIALLAAIVMVVLGSSRSKGVDAAVKQTMTQIATQIELYGAFNGNYGPTWDLGICPEGAGWNPPNPDPIFYADAKIKSMIDSLKSKNRSDYAKCATGGNNPNKALTWAVASPLSSGISELYWCVDSKGSRKLSSSHHSSFFTLALDTFVPRAFAVVSEGPDLGGGTDPAYCP